MHRNLGIRPLPERPRDGRVERSKNAERFTRTVGLPPMEYLFARRMAVAKDLLRRPDLGVAEVARRVGYGAANTFSTPFSRQVGQPPSRYARQVLCEEANFRNASPA